MARHKLIVSDNNGLDNYYFDTKAGATKERSHIIASYGYNKGKGFTRRTYTGVEGDMIVFSHMVYSTVVLEVIRL